MLKRSLFCLMMGLLTLGVQGQSDIKKRIGIIGLDTSHAIAFASMFNGSEAKTEFAGYQVTIAFPWGSKTIEEGYSRVPGFIEKAKGLGIKIAGSVEEVVAESDYIMLETQDGNLHIEQALAVFKAGKPMFIDKPMAANLVDICLIYKLAEKYKASVYTTSSFRYTDAVMEISLGRRGKVRGADCFGPCQEEPSHSSLFWYGIHGIEMLFSVMGTGCEWVSRTHTPETDLVVGTWKDKRVGTYRGMRIGKAPYYHFGGFAYCENEAVALDKYDGYGYYGLLREMIVFFKTGALPVSPETTIEIYAFMDASSRSVAMGKPVKISDVIAKAEKSALKKLKNYK